MKRYRFVVIVWGSHFDLLEKYALPSWMSPNNIDILRHSEIHVYTNDGVRAKDALSRFTGIIQIHGFEPSGNVGQSFQACLAHALDHSAKSKTPIILTPPDTIWGDGSLHNLVKIGEDTKTVVAFPHARVNLEDFEKLMITPVSNPRLVSLAMNNLHKSFYDSADGLVTNSYRSGVYIRKLMDKLWMVKHVIPTPYFVNAQGHDGATMMKQRDAGSWDHHWPGQLFSEKRWRVVGSSDACFAVELTPRDQNHPPLDPAVDWEPDKYRGNLPHHFVNKCYASIWRAE